MKVLCRKSIAFIGTLAALAWSAAAQSVVVTGTGNPDIDVPAVQAAVDQGGQVVLMGHFSFDRPPTKYFEHVNGRTILVSKQAVISGAGDENGDMTTIEGGDIPFAVDAPGAHVKIQRLRFIHPKEYVILVRAVSGLVVAYCRIEGIEPLADPLNPTGGKFANGIFVVTTLTLFPPSPAQPGQPENVSGTLSIFNNDIDAGGTAADNTLGISVYAVGKSPDQEVDLYISGNNVKNITERPININQISGTVHIERNVVSTGAIAGPTAGVTPDAIHAVGSGSYLIAHNTIISEWAQGAGIRVQGNAGLSEAGAIVVDNDVSMTAPESTVFANNSAAIEIRGFAQGNVVLNNRIRGRARAGLVAVGQGAGIPGNNTFVSNDLDGFQPSLAHVLVDTGVTKTTLVVGRQTSVEDRGESTVIARTP